jgi:LmbE family N-acetylglucosaminyl deacetylase
MREKGLQIVNVAVTQGSNKARQQARLQELQACCDYLGFDLVQTAENGLENITLRTRSERPEAWNPAVKRIAAILQDYQPRIILFPHSADRNSTHIGTHHLVVDALTELGSSFVCHVVETEFWGAMDTPNLMVESSESDVVDLVSALTFHVGEVQRNPYHLRMPAWLMDNVRRGGELVGTQGGAVPDFVFATLYRVRLWRDSGFRPVFSQGRFIPRDGDVGEPFAT